MRGSVTSAADLGRIVRYVREQHGLNQRDLAARLGVSQRYLSELELGKGKRADARYFQVLRDLDIQLTAQVDDE